MGKITKVAVQRSDNMTDLTPTKAKLEEDQEKMLYSH